VKVAIVNDDPLAVEALRRALLSAPAYTVAWVARDGAEAVRLCAAARPDVILMDLIMPAMDGVEATRRIMAATPCAILVVTADVTRNTSKVFAAMGAGALDVVSTPTLSSSTRDASAGALIAKIRLIGQLGVSYAPVVHNSSHGDGAPATAIIAIGASAGGPPAVAHVLRDLPATLPAAVVVVQHVDAEFVSSMAEWFDSQCELAVRVATHDVKPAPGCVYLAAGDTHLVVNSNGRLVLESEPHNTPYRPSADVLFSSIARNWPGVAIGVVLSGMGRDGAVGLRELRASGARTIAQDKATSAVYGMPRAAAELEAATDVEPLSRIGLLICELLEPARRPLPRRAFSPSRGS
jgi:two-component system, chemotaxis family, response regulator WspF